MYNVLMHSRRCRAFHSVYVENISWLKQLKIVQIGCDLADFSAMYTATFLYTTLHTSSRQHQGQSPRRRCPKGAISTLSRQDSDAKQ